MSRTAIHWQPDQPAFQELLATLTKHASPIYVVGGVVRDLLLGRPCQLNDIDLVLEVPVLPLARRIADRLGWAFYPIDESRDVARLIFPQPSSREPLVCDIAAMRGGSIEADLLSRDFTINAMALAIHANRERELIDLCNGQQDLASGIVRRVSPVSLAEDAIRLVRAVRLVVQFGFTLEEETRVQIERLASSVRLASPERVRDELWKCLATPTPQEGIHQLRALGLLPYLLPEVAATIGIEQSAPHYQDVFGHITKAVAIAAGLRDWVLGRKQETSSPAQAQMYEMLEPWRFRLRHLLAPEIAAGRLRGEWLVWDALLHDIGKPPTRTVETHETNSGTPPRVRIRFHDHERAGAELAHARLEFLRFSRSEINLCRNIIGHHMRPLWLYTSAQGRPLSRRACYRFFRDSGGRHFEQLAGIDIVLLSLADYLATYPEPAPPDWSAYLHHANQLLAFAFEDHERHGLQAKPLVNGDMLMQHFHLEPGKQLGVILDQLREAQVAGEVTTTEEALRLVSGWVQNPGVHSS